LIAHFADRIGKFSGAYFRRTRAGLLVKLSDTGADGADTDPHAGHGIFHSTRPATLVGTRSGAMPIGDVVDVRLVKLPQ
jgi:hypothetical protein